jgi:hypothetical protein
MVQIQRGDTGTGPTTTITTEDCILPCIEEHEAQHRKDLDECCRKLQGVVENTPPGSQADVAMKADVAMAEYMTNGKDWFECRAKKGAVDCLLNLWKQYNCGCGPCDSDCCKIIKTRLGKIGGEQEDACKKAEAGGEPKCPI